MRGGAEDAHGVDEEALVKSLHAGEAVRSGAAHKPSTKAVVAPNYAAVHLSCRVE